MHDPVPGLFCVAAALKQETWRIPPASSKRNILEHLSAVQSTQSHASTLHYLTHVFFSCFSLQLYYLHRLPVLARISSNQSDSKLTVLWLRSSVA